MWSWDDFKCLKLLALDLGMLNSSCDMLCRQASLMAEENYQGMEDMLEADS